MAARSAVSNLDHALRGQQSTELCGVLTEVGGTGHTQNAPGAVDVDALRFDQQVVDDVVPHDRGVQVSDDDLLAQRSAAAAKASC